MGVILHATKHAAIGKLITAHHSSHSALGLQRWSPQAAAPHPTSPVWKGARAALFWNTSRCVDESVVNTISASLRKEASMDRSICGRRRGGERARGAIEPR